MSDLGPLLALLDENGFARARKSKRGFYLNAYRRFVHETEPDDIGPYTAHVQISLAEPHEFVLTLYEISYGGRRRSTAHYHYLIDWQMAGFQFRFSNAGEAVERSRELIDAAVKIVDGRFRRHDEWRASPEGKLFEGLSPPDHLALTLRLMKERAAK